MAKAYQKIVVAGLIVKNNRVLVARRSTKKRIAPGKFHLPGGHIEFGEKPEDALQREIAEELSIRVKVKEPFYAFSYRIGKEHTKGLVFRAEYCGPDDQIRLDKSDNTEYRWIMESDLPAISSLMSEYNVEAIKVGLTKAEGNAQPPKSIPLSDRQSELKREAPNCA